MSSRTAVVDPDSSLDERLRRTIESEPAAVADPYPLYHDLLALPAPYQWGPTLVVSRFEDIRQIALDSVTFSNRAYSVGSRAEAIRAGLDDDQRVAFDEVAAFESLYISRSDGEQHARLRGIAHRAFTPRKMADLQALIQSYIDELLEAMAAEGQRDFVAGFSSRLPIMAICSLLNVPLTDIDQIKGWSARIGKNRGGAVVADLLDAHAALMEFRGYVAEIVAHHRRHPDTTDLVSALMGAADDHQLTEDELLATMVVLLFGGSDTTTALLGNGLHTLLTHRDQWRLLAVDPEGRVDATVEELARYVSPIQTTWRVTTESVELGGISVPAGATILLLVGASNRDPEQFEDPDTFDVERDAKRHLAFFLGSHFCLGASLARLEARATFRTLAERFPDLAARDARAGHRWRGNIQFRTIAELEVDFMESVQTPRRRST